MSSTLPSLKRQKTQHGSTLKVVDTTAPPPTAASKKIVRWLTEFQSDYDYNHVAPVGHEDTTTVVWMDKEKKSGCAIKALHFIVNDSVADTDGVGDLVESACAQSSTPLQLGCLATKLHQGCKLARETSVNTFTLSDTASESEDEDGDDFCE